MTTRHEEIAAALRHAIDQGEFPVGSSLPSENELAARHGASRGTVRQAVAALTAEGRIGSRQGARRVVLSTQGSQNFGVLRSFAQWARAAGRRPSGLVIDQHRAPATPQERLQLRLRPGAEVLHVMRLRGLDSEPVLLERTVYAPWIADTVEALPSDCESVVSALYEREGIVFAYGEHEIDAVSAGKQDAELLGTRRGGPLLRVRRTTSSSAGRPLECADDRYRAGTLSFSVFNAIGANLTPVAGKPHD